VVLLTCTIASLKSFDKIFVLTRGGPAGSTNTPAYFSFQNFFEKTNVGYGAAIATVLTVLILGLTFLFLRAQNRSESEGARAGAPAPSTRRGKPAAWRTRGSDQKAQE